MIIELILNILNSNTKLNIKSNTKSKLESNLNKTLIDNYSDNNNINKSFIDFLLNKDFYIYIIFFIIFCFGWNPKTSLTGDIGTNPLWKIPYNASKRILGFNSFRLFEDSFIIKWHKKYIE